MSKLFIFINVVFLSNPLYALDLGIQMGGDVRIQHSINPDFKEPMSAGVLGFSLKSNHWSLLEEIAFHQSNTSMGNVKIATQTLEWNQWLQYFLLLNGTYRPYVSLGAGLSQDKIKTEVGNASRVDKSRLYLNGAASAGLSWRWTQRLEALIEARVWKFEQKKDPTASGLLAVKLWL